ncbi:MAG TPA: TIGR02680 family protein [Pseudonocardiaceae bacterium]|nr:TIGR02680 family protein [Pseudonocardiaceae bacterium]
MLDLAVDGIAPWDREHWIAKAKLPKDKVWQFSVYGGIYGLSAVREALTTVFGRDDNEFVQRDDSQTAMFAFTLDSEGYLVEDSPALSACAWAISRLQDPGPDAPGWLEGFRSEEDSFIAALNRLVPPKRNRFGSAGNGLAAKTGKAVLGQVKGAATGAVSSGAKAAGDAVKVTTAAALTTVAGPVIGGIAGAVAGAFVEKLLTPRPSTSKSKPEAETPAPDQEKAPDQRKPEQPLSEPPRMTPRLVHAFVSRLGQALGVTDLLKLDGVRVKCVQVHKRTAEEASEQNFLNSFITDDLLRIEDAVRGGDVGDGISSYLADTVSIPAGNRVDVRACPDDVVARVAPSRIPGGRWPTGIDRPLVLSQQFAVNQIMGEFASASGVFAVNGPPGTGKTTMLRDVLAAIVVDRAQRIVDLRLAHPTGAFTERTDRVPVTSKYTAAVRWLRPELTGSEIVVATAGNKAAANITAEIPGIGAVPGAEEAACEADYFTELATNVLGSDAWGLIAAKLGKRSNRIAFVKHFWWGDPASGDKEPTGNENGSAQEQPEPIMGMKEILDEAAAQPLTADMWAEAVGRFKDVRAEVDRLAAERQRAADAIARIIQRRRELPGLQATADAARAETARRAADLAAAQAQLADAEKKVDEADTACEKHAKRQPNFWVSLATFFRAGREWHKKAGELDTALDRATAAADALRPAISHHRAAVGHASIAQRRHEVALDNTAHEIAALDSQLAQARAQWPERLPHRPDFATDEEFQLCAPWADAAYTEARNRLFLEALRLHKTFILATIQSELDTLARLAVELTDRATALAAEHHAAPSDTEVREAHIRLAAEHEAKRRADAALHEAVTNATERLEQARAARAATAEFADDVGLPTEAEALREVRAALGDYRVALAGLWPAARAADRAGRDVLEAEQEVAAALARRAECVASAEQARAEAAATTERHRVLVDTAGAGVDELYRKLDAVARQLSERDDHEQQARNDERAAIGERGKAEGKRLALRESIDTAAAERDSAITTLRTFVITGLLHTVLPGLDVPDPTANWAPTPAITLARAINAALEATDDADRAWELVQQRVSAEHKLLTDALSRHGHSVGMTVRDGIIVVDVLFAGHRQDIPTLVAGLAAETEHRAMLLSAKEREILENHLINEVAGTLQELITGAEEQVDAINADLADRPTSTGMRLRLRWRTARGAPDGLARVRDRLLRQTADAWTASDRALVGAFLSEQINKEHAEDAAGGWVEQLTRGLDYRAWHEFTIQRHQDGEWRSATGPASGGERVLAASVPLFAAASSFYTSAGNRHAPRLIALDEAFAGVDDDSRAKCLGLLAAFDLDVVMTSEREWGCYPQVPGLSIAQLTRRDGIDAVLVTPWRWDGRERAAVDRPTPYVPSRPEHHASADLLFE